MKKENCFILGYITKPHGIKGAVNVSSEFSGQPKLNQETAFIEINNELTPFLIEEILFKPKNIVLKFEDVDSYEKARDLVKATVFLPITSLNTLGETYPLYQIQDYRVIDKIEGDLGSVKEVLQFPQQLIVQLFINNKEVLFPLTSETLIQIDEKHKILYVNLPEGLLNIYLD